VKYVCYNCPLVSSPKLLEGYKWKFVLLLLSEFHVYEGNSISKLQIVI